MLWIDSRLRDVDGEEKGWVWGDEGGRLYTFFAGFFLVNRVRYNSVGLVFQLGNVLWVFFEFD